MPIIGSLTKKKKNVPGVQYISGTVNIHILTYLSYLNMSVLKRVNLLLTPGIVNILGVKSNKKKKKKFKLWNEGRW